MLGKNPKILRCRVVWADYVGRIFLNVGSMKHLRVVKKMNAVLDHLSFG